MFHVLDHADVVYTGELSQTTQYVLEHYGAKLDDAIRSGIRIAYADSRSSSHKVGETIPGSAATDCRKPDADWEID